MRRSSRTRLSCLARSGVHPKLAQTLARHSTINLTMDVYTHVELEEKAGAVAMLPALMSQAIARAGTTGGLKYRRSRGGGGLKSSAHSGALGCPKGAKRVSADITELSANDATWPTQEALDAGQGSDRKPKRSSKFGRRCQRLAVADRDPGGAKSEVPPAGFEPATCGLGNRRSIQLSYGDMPVRLLVPPGSLPRRACTRKTRGAGLRFRHARRRTSNNGQVSSQNSQSRLEVPRPRIASCRASLPDNTVNKVVRPVPDRPVSPAVTRAAIVNSHNESVFPPRGVRNQTECDILP